LHDDSSECSDPGTSVGQADISIDDVSAECVALSDDQVGAQIALVHGFSDQDELLRLLQLCPRDNLVRILLSEGMVPADAVPILFLGLANVEVLSFAKGTWADLEPVDRIFQGTINQDGSGLEALQLSLSRLSPGGSCSLLISERSPDNAAESAAAAALLDCLGKLALWVAAGSSTLPPVPWWANVKSIQLQPGLATICVRSASALDSVPMSSSPELSTGFGRAAEVIAEMQHEVNRLFDLYNTAYMRAQSLQFEAKELRRLLVGCQSLNLRYRGVLRKALDVLGRLAGSSAD
jgi:hypothetical protein